MPLDPRTRKRVFEETHIHYIPQAAVRNRAQHVFVDRFRGNKRQVIREKVDFFLPSTSSSPQQSAVPAQSHQAFAMPPPLDYKGRSELDEESAAPRQEAQPSTNARYFRTAVRICYYTVELRLTVC